NAVKGNGSLSKAGAKLYPFHGTKKYFNDFFHQKYTEITQEADLQQEKISEGNTAANRIITGNGAAGTTNPLR
ncbi:MAG: hypothetical protein J6J09_02245, partial [Phocaeicola sp.]|nr:hypothetical protein [Phocaeicola sp.]